TVIIEDKLLIRYGSQSSSTQHSDFLMNINGGAECQECAKIDLRYRVKQEAMYMK
ncbi:unnamed protein product, partial [Didymodactylos carnosus]